VPALVPATGLWGDCRGPASQQHQ